ncbi:MAG: hypothetical protein FWD35_03210 [Oscillospiraceae bacterium]|nr:hypothetical protein [Oscillospiraceae bacterium]
MKAKEVISPKDGLCPSFGRILTTTKITQRLTSLFLTFALITAAITTAASASAPTYTATATQRETVEEVRRAILHHSEDGRYFLPIAAVDWGMSESEFIEFYYAHTFMTTAQYTAHYYYHSYHGNNPGFPSRHLVAGEVLYVDYHGVTANSEGYGVVRIPTSQAVASVPDNLRTFRFGSYVSPHETVSANLLGAYGLMHELGAYYYDLRLTADLADYVAQFIARNGIVLSVDDWNNPSATLITSYASTAFGSILALYEFTFWTLEYMAFLKANHPDEFAEFMSNDNLRKTFAYFYLSGQCLIYGTMPAKEAQLTAVLRSAGISVTFEADNSIWLESGGFSRGIGGDALTEASRLSDHIATERLSAMLSEMLDGYGDIFECNDCCAEPSTPPQIADISHALAILRHIIGLENNAHVSTHDFNGDGVLDINDALLVLRSIIGLAPPQVLRL